MPEVDFAGLAAISATLSEAGDAIVKTGKDIPTSTDAGQGAAAITAIMSHIIENAARVCDGLDVCAHGVDQSNADYQVTDRDSATGFSSLRQRGAP